MYMYDPQLGRRRRAVARDKLIHVGYGIDDAVDVTSRDLRNRSVGLLAAMRSVLRRRGSRRSSFSGARALAARGPGQPSKGDCGKG
jgi:hypothetical protein